MFVEYTLQENPSRGGLSDNLGVCPTREHSTTHPQCGFAGCVDLQPWAKVNRYRFRLEESHRAENNQHIKGDGRWFVEIPCRYGLIYPCGGDNLLAYATRGVKCHIAALGPDIQHYQNDGDAKVFKFPVERLDEVAAILKPRRRRKLTPEQARKNVIVLEQARKRLSEIGQAAVERTQSAGEGVSKGVGPYVTFSG